MLGQGEGQADVGVKGQRAPPTGRAGQGGAELAVEEVMYEAVVEPHVGG